MNVKEPGTFKFGNIRDVHKWLDSIPTFQKVGMLAANMNLQQITNFCNAIGSPHQKINAIHVAGTNGKGATCAMLSSAYTQAGYKTGLFTSPHLLHVNERIRIDGQLISDDELLAFFQEHSALLSRITLTYFEITVALAFWTFRRNNVDIAIIETGLGGRLDATNIITPLVSVITTVSLDHTNYLGSALDSITREKAGIIKKGIPVVTGNLPDQALKIIETIADQKGSGIFRSSDLSPAYDNTEKKCSLHISGKLHSFEMPGLMAPVQRYNLATAWQVTRVIENRFPVTIKDFHHGLKQAGKVLPGRFERLMDDKRWFFDGAHNKQALDALKETIATVGQPEEAIMIFALMNDKVDENILMGFSDFKKNYYYAIETQRAAAFEDIRRSGLAVEQLPAEKVGLYDLLGSFKTELVIFTGSFYFYSIVKEWLAHIRDQKN